MEATLLAKRLRPKTYSIAVYLVGLVFLLQLAAVISVFYFRSMIRIDTQAPPLIGQGTASGGEIAPALAPERIIPAPSNPARLAVEAGSDVSQRVKALNEEAARFQLQGDARLATLALQKAESLDPNDPDTLMNLAKASVTARDDAKARAYWQRVVDLGPDIGTPYVMAKEQIILADSRLAASNNPATATASPSTPVTPAVETRALFVDKIDKTPAVDDSSGNDFTLRIGLAAGNVAGGIQAGKVDIKLYFYDQQSGGAIVPSKAQLHVSFLGARQTWANGKPEILVASYQLTPDQARIYNQKYYGYMLRVYYDGKLQDERAEPENLLKFFPATTI